MAKVIMFSRHFPKYHPKAGQPTNFVASFWANPKIKILMESIELLQDEYLYWKKNKETLHPKGYTIRAGHRFKKGDMFSPRVWGDDINPKSGKSGPYHSKQIIISPDTEVLETWDFEIEVREWGIYIYIDGIFFGTVIKKNILEARSSLKYIKELAKNDGLEYNDFLDWFQFPIKKFKGQIICWNPDINY